MAKRRIIIVGFRAFHPGFHMADLVVDVGSNFVDVSKRLRPTRGVLWGYKFCPPSGKVKGSSPLQKKALFFLDASHLLPRTKLGANGDDRGKHAIGFTYLGV